MLQEQSVMLLFLNKSTTQQQKQFLLMMEVRNTGCKPTCPQTKKVA
jgi:hypothetical protein